MSTTALPTLPSDLLTRPAGGVTMQLTQYGYPGQPVPPWGVLQITVTDG